MSEEPKKPEHPEESQTVEQDQHQEPEQQQEQRQAHDEERSEEGFKDMTEKFWDATRKTFSTATFKAGQYRRIVQKKIDLASLHKKIGAAHGDLGQLVDEAHEAGDTAILEREDVRNLLQKLDELKQNAAVLEHEIEMIKAEDPPEEPDSPPETKP